MSKLLSQSTLLHTLQSDEIRKWLLDYCITKLWLVGSYSRWTQHKESDIDLVYEDDDTISPTRPRWVFGAIDFLEKKIGKSVDLLHTSVIKRKEIEEMILANKIKIW